MAQRLVRPARVLAWNLRQLALDRGIQKPTQLAERMGIPRQSVYGPWNNDAPRFTLDRLTEYVSLLKADPGDWFGWNDGQLTFAIQERAAERGIARTDLPFRSALYPQTIDGFWFNTRDGGYLDILARLALALDMPGHPFHTGTIFIWEDQRAAVEAPIEDVAAAS